MKLFLIFQFNLNYINETVKNVNNSSLIISLNQILYETAQPLYGQGLSIR